jgi:signal transduction histidine kinase
MIGQISFTMSDSPPSERSDADWPLGSPYALTAIEARLREAGRDLHDGIGQQLTALTLMADALEKQIQELARHSRHHSQFATQLSAIANSASKVRQLTGEAALAARDAAHGLLYAPETFADLVLALTRLAGTIDELPNLECQFRCSGTLAELPSHVIRNLFRISQEATNNAMKHSGATMISIELDAREHVAILEIADNGSRSPRIPDRSGCGLEIMRQRALEIGGVLSVVQNETGNETESETESVKKNETGNDGGGSTVRCEVPISDRVRYDLPH